MIVDTIICELQAPADDKPQWVHLLTHGVMNARDGRRFVLSDATAVVERTLMRAGKASLPVDYDHQIDNTVMNGRPAPAAGWMTRLEVRQDGIWALVEWTAKARQMLAAREYRYISPTFQAFRETGEVRVLLRAALTNNPALELTALASSQDGAIGDMIMALPKEIAAELGLSETATATDAVAAIRALSGGGAQMASTLAALAGVVTEMNELKRSSSASSVKAKVESAILAGTVMPSLRSWATELCSTNEALFDSFVAKVGTPFAYLTKEAVYDQTALAAAADTPSTGLEETIARQLGVDPARLKS
jgi:phage I-like protein